jgi:hypothetical protein
MSCVHASGLARGLRRVAWGVACAASALGCASMREYTCPEPIGRIVQDDCDDYRTRYEQVSVDLGFSFGGFGVTAKVGEEKLREVSELVQVLQHQSMALCRDFNQCRLPPPDYRRRREAIDRAFTAVTAITGQLRNETLSAGQRAALLERLLAVAAGEGPAEAEPPAPKKPARDPFHRPRAAKLVPPAAPLAPAVPRVVDAHLSTARDGAIEAVHLVFAPFAPTDVQPDDRVELSVGDQAARCEVHRDTKHGGGRARCKLEPPARGPLSLAYVPGRTAQRSVLGPLPLEAETQLGRAWLAWETEIDEDGGEGFERAALVVPIAKAGARLVARCRIGEQRLQRPMRSTRAERHGAIHRAALPLPIRRWTIDAPMPKDPDQLFIADRHAGAWSCRLSADGDPLGSLEFTLGADGLPVDDAAARASGGALQPPWWPIVRRPP